MPILKIVKLPKILKPKKLIPLATLCALLAVPLAIFAISNFLPDPADFSQQGDTYLLNISETGTSTSTQALVTWGKLYFNPARGINVQTRIFDAPFSRCNGANDTAGMVEPGGGFDPDVVNCASGSPVDTPDERVWYDFFATRVDASDPQNPQEVEDRLLFSINSQTVRDQNGVPRTTVRPNGWSDPVAINVDWPASSVTGQYVVLVRARWDRPMQETYYNPEGRLNFFKYDAVDGKAGYWAQVDPSPEIPPREPPFGQYAILSSESIVLTGGKQFQSDWEINFAPPCALTRPRAAAVRWSDADHYRFGNRPPDGRPQFEGDLPPTFDLFEINAQTGSETKLFTIDGNSRPNIGGQDDYREKVFIVKPKHKYRWVWRNINSGNDVVLWVPYDSFFFDAQCPEITLGKSVPAGGTYEPGAEVTYLLELEENTGAELGSLTVTDPLSGQPVSYVDHGVFGPSGGTLSNPPPRWRFASGSAALTEFQNSGTMRLFLDVRINDNAPNGCFDNTATASATDNNGNPLTIAPSTARICVQRPRRPFLTTRDGDVHAGAAWGDRPCLTNGLSAQVIRGATAGSRGSKGDYIVSAGGNISQFGSAGSPGSNNLTFGNSPTNGRYGQICRPDLVARYLADSASLPSRPAAVPASPGTFNTPAYNDRVVYIQPVGPFNDLRLGGGTVAAGQHTTLLVEGDVYIEDDITYSTGGYASRASVPAFSVIASGNIYISPNVSELFGIYYAGSALPGSTGMIDTCRQRTGPPPFPAPGGPAITLPGQASVCNQQLLVNGALIATEFKFRRTGGDVEGP